MQPQTNADETDAGADTAGTGIDSSDEQRTDSFGRPIRTVDPTDNDWFRAHAFAGLGTEAFAAEPDAYAEARADAADTFAEQSLADTIRTLHEHYGVTERDVAYRDEVGAWSETERHIALVNPATDALYHVPTRQYSPATPDGLYGPLANVLLQRDLQVFGEARVRRGGGDQHLDVFVHDESTTVEQDLSGIAGTAQLVLGFEVSHDYFGGKRHTASPIALDTETGAIYRDVLPDRRRKHTGNAVQDVGAWYKDLIDLLQASTDRLASAIADANEYEFDAVTDGDVPIDADGLYALLDFPSHETDALASCAGDRLSVMMSSGFNSSPNAPTAWQVFHAGASAITHDYDAQLGGGAITERVTALNRVLFTPASAERDMLAGARADLLEELDDTEREALDRGLSSFVDDETQAEYDALGERMDALDGSVPEYRSVKERLNAIMTAAENELSDDEEAESEETVTDGGTTLDAFAAGANGGDSA